MRALFFYAFLPNKNYPCCVLRHAREDKAMVGKGLKRVSAFFVMVRRVGHA
jgi:hypothetical protein